MLCAVGLMLRSARRTDVRAEYVRESCLCRASSFLGLRSPYVSCRQSQDVRCGVVSDYPKKNLILLSGMMRRETFCTGSIGLPVQVV